MGLFFFMEFHMTNSCNNAACFKHEANDGQAYPVQKEKDFDCVRTTTLVERDQSSKVRRGRSGHRIAARTRRRQREPAKPRARTQPPERTAWRRPRVPAVGAAGRQRPENTDAASKNRSAWRICWANHAFTRADAQEEENGESRNLANHGSLPLPAS